MHLPRKVTRMVVLSGLLLAGMFVLYTLRMKDGSRVPSLSWWDARLHHEQAVPTQGPEESKRRRLPRVQAEPRLFKANTNTGQSSERRQAVRREFKRSYDAYRSHAWLRDELRPVTGGARDPFGGWAATLVDSLDTLFIMGFTDEFDEAVAAVSTIDWSRTESEAANMFETTIRHLGGLLSAYDLSGDARLLSKAAELGSMLYHGFDTPNGMPPFWLDFAKARAGRLEAGTHDPSASPCSLGLEFTRLSQLTGDDKYWAATDRITRFLAAVRNDTRLPGMWPLALNFRDQRATDATFTLGAGADSLYEYLPKMHALLAGADDVYESLFRGAMDVVVRHLLFRPMLPGQDDVLFTGEYRGGELDADSQHLSCFVGGMFALGGRLFDIEGYVGIGDRLARGCAWAYAQFPTGIMPEIFGLVACPRHSNSADDDDDDDDSGPVDVHDSLDACPWDEAAWEDEKMHHAYGNQGNILPRGFAHARERQYILRPEAIESIFVLYRVTAQEDLLDIAWDMFESIVKATRTDLANSAISDVTTDGPTDKMDSMESFWMAETLKYFYLIFSPPDLISLDEWVFNTEAHPLKRPQLRE